MDVIAPPYWEPKYMPEIMIIAESGDIPYVRGSRMATVPDIPRPGSTPMRDPRRDPTMAQNMFIRDKQSTKPFKSKSN